MVINQSFSFPPLQTSSSMQITKALEALKDDYPYGLKNPGSENDMNILEKVDALEVKT